jgi:inhibitor of KinA sporulation pathway (predicted exonuclease)
MNYIVLDLEWNPCPGGKEQENKRMPFEIIEIGAVKLNALLQPIDTFQTTISPRVYHDIHFKVKEMTNITMDTLHGSPNFKTAIHAFLDWCGEDYRFCTWGSMDLTELQRNMQYYKIRRPLYKPLIYYNIQKLYWFSQEDPTKTMSSLAAAIEQFGLTQDVSFHRALNDAHYTGEVMRRIDFNKWSVYYSIDCYYAPASKQETITAHFPTYTKYVSQTFSSSEFAMRNRTVKAMTCHICGKPMHITVPWFMHHQRVYYGAAVCLEHGMHRCKVKLCKTPNGRLYAVKVTVPATEAEYHDIIEKHTSVKEKRKKT